MVVSGDRLKMMLWLNLIELGPLFSWKHTADMGLDFININISAAPN